MTSLDVWDWWSARIQARQGFSALFQKVYPPLSASDWAIARFRIQFRPFKSSISFIWVIVFVTYLAPCLHFASQWFRLSWLSENNQTCLCVWKMYFITRGSKTWLASDELLTKNMSYLADQGANMNNDRMMFLQRGCRIGVPRNYDKFDPVLVN